MLTAVQSLCWLTAAHVAHVAAAAVLLLPWLAAGLAEGAVRRAGSNFCVFVLWLTAAHVPLFCCYHCLQDWLELPFKSRRNIIISMVVGTGAVWFWNKSEQQGGRRAGSKQVQHTGARIHGNAQLNSSSKAAGTKAASRRSRQVQQACRCSRQLNASPAMHS
jgi:undecaprenyl pyrophosphate phosphatase UppP